MESIMQLMTERQRTYFLQKPVATLAFITFGRNSQTIYSLVMYTCSLPAKYLYIYMDTCVHVYTCKKITYTS